MSRKDPDYENIFIIGASIIAAFILVFALWLLSQVQVY